MCNRLDLETLEFWPIKVEASIVDQVHLTPY